MAPCPFDQYQCQYQWSARLSTTSYWTLPVLYRRPVDWTWSDGIKGCHVLEVERLVFLTERH